MSKEKVNDSVLEARERMLIATQRDIYFPEEEIEMRIREQEFEIKKDLRKETIYKLM